MKTITWMTLFISGLWVGWVADSAAGEPEAGSMEPSDADTLEVPAVRAPTASFLVTGLSLGSPVAAPSDPGEGGDIGSMSPSPDLLGRVTGDESLSSWGLAPAEIEPDSGPQEGRVLEVPVWGSLSLVGSTVGGGTLIDEPVKSVHGRKVARGLYAIPDHEVVVGFNLPISRGSRLGLAYRNIQADAQWGTDRYWGVGAVPVLVEETWNQGGVLVFVTRF